MSSPLLGYVILLSKKIGACGQRRKERTRNGPATILAFCPGGRNSAGGAGDLLPVRAGLWHDVSGWQRDRRDLQLALAGPLPFLGVAVRGLRLVSGREGGSSRLSQDVARRLAVILSCLATGGHEGRPGALAGCGA